MLIQQFIPVERFNNPLDGRKQRNSLTFYPRTLPLPTRVRFEESKRKELSRRESKGAAVEITNRSSMEESKLEIKGEDSEKGKATPIHRSVPFAWPKNVHVLLWGGPPRSGISNRSILAQ